MKDKRIYDRNRHYEIRVNGKKARIMKHLFKTHETGKKCIVLKTKFQTNLITECDWHIPCKLEIPDGESVLTIFGVVCSVLAAPNNCEIWLEIIPDSAQ